MSFYIHEKNQHQNFDTDFYLGPLNFEEPFYKKMNYFFVKYFKKK